MKHKEFLKQMKERAEHAKPGKWEYKEFDEHTIEESCHGVICTDDFHIGNGFGKDDGEFVEACCPQAALKLLAIIEKLKVQRYRMLAEKYAGFPNQAMNEDTILDAELDEIVGLG